MEKLFILDNEFITESHYNYSELMKDHKSEWEGISDTFNCDNCQNQLPKGFAHSEDCEMLIAIWL